MTKSFLTATALVALLGFGATGALAQQTAPKLDTPAIQKSAPVNPGKVDSGTVKDKSKATTSNSSGTTKPAAGATKSSAASCAGIKDKTAHDACLKSHAKSGKAPAANQKATTPKDTTKPMVAPAPRG